MNKDDSRSLSQTARIRETVVDTSQIIVKSGKFAGGEEMGHK